MMKRTLMIILITSTNLVFTKVLYIPGDLILGGLFPVHRWTVIDGQPVCSENIQVSVKILNCMERSFSPFQWVTHENIKLRHLLIN